MAGFPDWARVGAIDTNLQALERVTSGSAVQEEQIDALYDIAHDMKGGAIGGVTPGDLLRDSLGYLPSELVKMSRSYD